MKFPHLCRHLISQVFFRQSYYWNFIGAAALLYIGGSISLQTSWPLVLTLFLPLSHDAPWALWLGVVLLMYPLESSTSWSVVLAFWPVVNFCDGLHWLQKEASLMSGENYPYLWVLRIHNEVRKYNCFRKVGIVGPWPYQTRVVVYFDDSRQEFPPTEWA